MEIRFHEDDLSVVRGLAAGRFDPPPWFALKTRAEALSLSRGFDRLLALEGLSLALHPHQEAAVLRVLREMRGRAVLADEVGLGKTIEAGVILREYLLRGLVQRCLILVPAPLVAQWRSELREKLGLHPRESRGPEGWRRHPLVLASLDTARRPEHAACIHEQPWDLVVVDEAHRLKNRTSLSWRFVDRIQKKYLLLLTATPIQNDLVELYNLITLLKPGQLKTYAAFRREFMADRRSPKNAERLRSLLGEVLVRTTRRQALLPLPRRRVTTRTVAAPAGEREFYQRVLDVARRAYRAGGPREGRLLPLILLLREAASHPAAARRTLAVLARRGGLPGISREELASLNAWAQRLEPGWSKARALLELARQGSGPLLAFTEFRAAQRELARFLAAAGIRAACLHGGMDRVTRQEVLAAFREGRSPVLISTQTGGEGQNLQFCRRLVNYDLPWNPMRIEQRIGRVHRLGQRCEVEVWNLLLPGTVEEHVLRLLEGKIRLFERVIGELDVILSHLEGDFTRRVAGAVLASTGPGDLARRLEPVGDALAEAAARCEEAQRKSAGILDPPAPPGLPSQGAAWL